MPGYKIKVRQARRNHREALDLEEIKAQAQEDPRPQVMKTLNATRARIKARRAA